MIEYERFKDIISPAERALGRIDEETRKIYWEAVKRRDENAVRLAIGQIIATHGYYKFPTVAEVLDAIGDNRPLAEIQSQEPVCSECHGVGRRVVEYWVGEGVYNKEIFCSCEQGSRQRRARADYFERKLLTSLAARGISSKGGFEENER